MPTTSHTINRLLSRREKDGSDHRRQKSRDKSTDSKTRPVSAEILSMLKSDPLKNIDKEQALKVEKIQKRLWGEGYTSIEDGQVSYALSSKYAQGDVDKAFEMVVLFQESVEGIIKPYDPSIHMEGAENRQAVTCYLDSLLFAMFARLGSFEPILRNTFDDEPRRRLSVLIRLWVNMLRTGKLIQTDITEHLQEALAACGWKDAAKIEQQDTSEAFSFITEKLELPLLTLKMDIYHTGAEDATDDHKFIHERLLEVAVPDDNGSGRAIQLEDCLESYFNNRIEVVRRLERSNTASSVRSQMPDIEKGELAQHVEISNVAWSTPNTPASAQAPETPLSAAWDSTPTSSRHRATSIIRHRIIADDGDLEASADSDAEGSRKSKRKGSIVRKEVKMPAWQFFNLIPWYTKNSPANDAEVAAHFSETRPVLGICLKRYAFTDQGTATRKDTFIDIPLDIRLPHFIQDDVMPDDGPLMGNFKLSLQSLICHRGNNVNSGHYISFIRGTSSADGDFTSSRKLSNVEEPPTYPKERWIKFDDFAEPRVSYADIEKALKDEMPYLLFYQVQPTYDSAPPLDPECLPPSYTDSGIEMRICESSPVVSKGSEQSYLDAESNRASYSRFSAEIERPRQSLTLPDEERRGSVAFTETSIGSVWSLRKAEAISAPVTPNEETTAQRMSRAAARFTKSGSRSRPTSATGENRISATFSRIALMRSKDSLNKVDLGKDANKAEQSKDIPTTDGAAELYPSLGEDELGVKQSDGVPTHSRSKKIGKKDKSKGPLEKEQDNHHLHRQKAHGKDRDVPERECKIM